MWRGSLIGSEWITEAFKIYLFIEINRFILADHTNVGCIRVTGISDNNFCKVYFSTDYVGVTDNFAKEFLLWYGIFLQKNCIFSSSRMGLQIRYMLSNGGHSKAVYVG